MTDEKGPLTVSEWRLQECIRIVGYDLAREFCTPEQLKEWLL